CRGIGFPRSLAPGHFASQEQAANRPPYFGAKVTVFDNSPRQLAQDRLVAEREGLSIETVQGDMRDLHVFGDESFQLVVHPCSNCFVPEVRPVWREVFRILAPSGTLLAGFINPAAFI